MQHKVDLKFKFPVHPGDVLWDSEWSEPFFIVSATDVFFRSSFMDMEQRVMILKRSRLSETSIFPTRPNRRDRYLTLARTEE